MPRRRALPPRAPRLRRLPPRPLVERLRVEGRARRKPSRRAGHGGRAPASAGPRSRHRLCRAACSAQGFASWGISSWGSTATRRPEPRTMSTGSSSPTSTPGYRPRRWTRRPFDLDPRRRRARAPPRSRASPARVARGKLGRGDAHLERAEHRSLVPAATHRPRPVRLRPSRHPRRDAPALLHLRSFAAMTASRRLAGGAEPPDGRSLRSPRLRRRRLRPPKVAHVTRARRPCRTSGVAVALRVPVRHRPAPRPCVRLSVPDPRCVPIARAIATARRLSRRPVPFV